MKKTFCPLPWIHLASMPNGEVPLCTNSDHSFDSARNFTESGYEILNLNTHKISEIVNSDSFKQVRLQFLNNEKPLTCKKCFDEENAGVLSKRIQSLREFKMTESVASTITSKDGTIPLEFEDLEFRLGNACNLKCTTCNPQTSSMWMTDYKKISKKIDFFPPYLVTDAKNFKWHANPNYWEEISHYSKKVQSVYINGGEPLLNKDHVEFLKKLDPSIRVKYNTNGTLIPPEVIDVWKRFRHVQVDISIDDIFERAEYIRYPAKWNILENNLQKFNSIEYIDIAITQTVSVYNIFYVKEFRQYFENLGIHTHFNFLKVPEFLSIGNLSDNAVEIILEKHKDEKYIQEIKNFLIFSNVEPDEKTRNMNRFHKYTLNLDTIRNTSFNNTFNEWAKILKQQEYI